MNSAHVQYAAQHATSSTPTNAASPTRSRAARPRDLSFLSPLGPTDEADCDKSAYQIHEADCDKSAYQIQLTRSSGSTDEADSNESAYQLMTSGSPEAADYGELDFTSSEKAATRIGDNIYQLMTSGSPEAADYGELHEPRGGRASLASQGAQCVD